jgi:low temperature requirement protein LtrA
MKVSLCFIVLALLLLVAYSMVSKLHMTLDPTVVLFGVAEFNELNNALQTLKRGG